MDENRRFVAMVAALLIGMALLPAAAYAARARQDVNEITNLLRQTWEQGAAPLQIRPVVVVGDYAIAGWVQEQRGGRALLRQKERNWTIVLCSGEALRHPDVLVQTGMEQPQARKLVRMLDEAEARLPTETRRLFDGFEGIMLVDDVRQMHGHTK